MRKNFLLIFFALLILIISNKTSIGVPAISTPTCSGPIPDVTLQPPVHTLRYHCTTTISGTGGSTYMLGVYSLNYTTEKQSGNGSNIDDYRLPDATRYRFLANGSHQGGNSENITTNTLQSDVTRLIDSISTDGSYSFDLLYDTYEADLGGTSYIQPFTIALYQGEGLPVNSNSNGQLSFTVDNWLYIYKYADPAVNVAGGRAFFNKNTIYASDDNIIEISANNQWTFQLSLSGDLSSGSNTAAITDNYFKCVGTGFINLVSDFQQFTVGDQYYDLAQNTPGEFSTGSSDGKRLDKKQIKIIFGFKNSEIYKPGNYKGTVNLKITTP